MRQLALTSGHTHMNTHIHEHTQFLKNKKNIKTSNQFTEENEKLLEIRATERLPKGPSEGLGAS